MSLSWKELDPNAETGDAQAPASYTSRLKLEFGPPDSWGFICPTCKGFVPLCYTNGPITAREPRPEVPGPVALMCPTCRCGDLFSEADLCLGRTPTKLEAVD